MNDLAQSVAPLHAPEVSQNNLPARSVTIWVNRDDKTRARDHVKFRTFWTLNAGDATEEEVLNILCDHESFSNWWGRSFLGTDVVHRPETGMLGMIGDVTSRGYLPYIFRWRAEVIAADADAVTLSAEGDFNGTGTFRRPRPGEEADLCFDWDVRIAKPLLRFFTPYACPLYLWNHAYAMADGAQCLQNELLRRRDAAAPPKVALSPKTMGPIALFKTGSSNIVSTIPAQLLSLPMMSGRLFWKWHSIAGRDEMQRVLVKNEANYPKAPVVGRILRPAVKHSFFLETGTDHLWKRKAALPHFSMRQSLEHIPDFVDIAEAEAAKLPQEDTFRMDALEHMIRVAISVILRVTCSAGDDVDSGQIRDAFTDYVENLARLTPLDLLSLPPVLAARMRGGNTDFVANLRQQVDGIVKRRMAEDGGAYNDVLQTLIDSADPDTGKTMSFEQVRDNFLMLGVAGHETTANTLGWAVHMLATHPEIQSQARAEAITAFEGAPEDLAKSLPLLSNIVDETLRLYPGLPLLVRKTKSDDLVGRCKVKRGSFMFIPFYALHRSRRFWKNPDSFCPARFSPDAPEKIEKNQYLPFSAGPRSCVGAAFAQLEMRIVLADFLRRFRFKAVPGTPPKPTALLSLKPQGGVWIDVERVKIHPGSK